MDISRLISWLIAVACFLGPARSQAAREQTSEPVVEPGPAASLPPGWVLDHWSAEDGLPLDHLNGIAVDGDGLVWITTFDGLVSFDGVDFHTLRVGDSLGPTSERLLQVLSGPAGDAIWVLDEHAGLQRRAGDHVTTLSDPRWQAREVFSRGTDGVWLVTDAGVTRLGEAPVAVSTPGIRPRWVVTGPAGGLAIQDEDGSIWTRAPRSTAWVQALGEGRSWGHPQRQASTGLPVFAGPGADTWVCSPAAASCQQEDISDFVSIELPPTPSRWRFVDHSMVMDDVTIVTLPAPIASFTDDGRSVWIATLGAGLFRLRRTPLIAVQPDADAVSTGLFNTENLWWEASAGVLWGLDEHLGPWAVATTSAAQPSRPSFPAGYASDCPIWTRRYFSSPAGVRWLSCGRHLFEWEESGWTDRAPAGKWGDGRAWFTGRGEILGALPGPSWLRQGGAWRQLEAPTGTPVDLLSVVELPDGTVLLGGRSGLWGLSPGARDAVALVGWKALGDIRHLRVDGPSLWLATSSRGLCVMPLADIDATKARCLGVRAGRSGTIHASLRDGRGHTWLSSNQGLAVASTASLARFADGGEQPAILWLDETDGMSSREGNGFRGDAAVRLPDGRLAFATQDGVTLVDVDSFASPPPPVARITTVDVGDQRILDATVLDLPVDHDVVHLTWSTGAVLWADQVEYRYRLGDKRPWSKPSEERGLSLHRLAPGSHVFEVQARLLGAWGPAATMVIRREPSLQEKTWFPLLLGFGLVGGLVAGLGAWGAGRARLGRRLAAQVAAQTRQLETQNEALESAVVSLAAKSDLLQVSNKELVEQGEALQQQGEKLRRQADELRQLDRLKRQLLANVSHELRTPLSLVVAPLGRVREQLPANSEERRLVGLALDQSTRLQQLIGQLFELSKVQAGGVQLHVRRVDLADLLARTLSSFRERADQRGVVLELVVPAHPVIAWVDSPKIERCIDNLVSNALHHAPAGTTVHGQLSVDDDVAFVDIVDEGPGVALAQREKIFQRFFRGDGPDERTDGGAGLGLAIVKELVELHGGEVCSVERDRGACFRITLPLGTDHLDVGELDLDEGPGTARLGDSTLPSSSGVSASADTAQDRRARLLLVEDHVELAEFLADSLAEHFSVRVARNGQQALDALVAGDFDVVVSDIMMPVLDGLSMVAALRKREGAPYVPVILISARQELEDRVEALDLADDYLAKPFHVRELVARVHALLRRDAAASTPDDSETAAADACSPFERKLREVADPLLSRAGFATAALARAMAMSARTLQRRMAQEGLPTPSAWLRDRRLALAHQMISAGRGESVSEVAAAVGLGREYLTRIYAAEFGLPPGEDIRRRFVGGTGA